MSTDAIWWASADKARRMRPDKTGKMRPFGVSTSLAAPRRVASRQEGELTALTPDYLLVGVIATLLALGLVMVYSASFVGAETRYNLPGAYFFQRQLIWAALGIVALIGMARVPYGFWQRRALAILCIALAVLVLVLLIGTRLFGGLRWLFNGSGQPSEFVKLAVVIYVAAWVASRDRQLTQFDAGFLPFALLMGLVVGLIVLQQSLSIAIIVGIIGATMFFVGGGEIKQIALIALIAAAVGAALVLTTDYRLKRVTDWLTMVLHPSQASPELLMIREILSRGHGIGTNPDNWLPKGALPVLWSDFLFANIGADLGFPGSVGVVALYALLGYRGLRIALNARDRFAALAALGVTTWILAQAAIHIGTCLLLIPVTGIPLPLMSYGGSSMLSCMAGMGLLLSISRASADAPTGGADSGSDSETYSESRGEDSDARPSLGRWNGGTRGPDSGRGQRASGEEGQPPARDSSPLTAGTAAGADPMAGSRTTSSSLDRRRPAVELCFVGEAGGMEEELVRRAGIPFRPIATGQIRGRSPRVAIKNLARMARGVAQCAALLQEFRPDVVFITGGYVTAPVAWAARFSRPRVPLLIYLPDITPGLAVRATSRLAAKVAVSFPEVAANFGRKAVVTGYPVRRELLAADKAGARRRLILEGDTPVLLVLGGSRGARSINRALAAALPVLLERCQIVHVSGQLDWPAVAQAASGLPAALSMRYRAYPYLHEEMVQALAAADLVVARAGAATLGEFPAVGLPSVLVPYPYAGQHQDANAAYLASRGAATILRDHELGERLAPTLLGLLDAPERMAAMSRAAAALARPQAAAEIAGELRRLAGGTQATGNGT